MSGSNWSAVRTILPKEKGNRGFFPSDKVSGGVVEYESQIERDFYLLLDHDPSVKRFQHQPLKLVWKDKDKKQKHYVPDVLIEFQTSKRLLVEIKDKQTYQSERKKYEERWRVAQEYTQEHGFLFKIITDKEICTPRLANIWFTLGSSRCDPNPQEVNTLIKLTTTEPNTYNEMCFELAKILKIELGKSAQLLCYAIYHGLVWVLPFSTKLLSGDTMINKKSTESTLFPSLWDRLEWISPNERKNSNQSRIQIKSETFNLDVDDFVNIPVQYHEVVKDREKIVQEWIRHPSWKRTVQWRTTFCKIHDISETTIYIWLKNYKKEGLAGLIPKYRQAGRKSPYNQQELELLEKARRYYLQPGKTLTRAYSEMYKDWDKLGVDPPSFSMMKKYIYNYTTSAEFEQAKKGRKYYKSHFESSMGSFQGAIMPMQVLQFDNTQFDNFPVDSEYRLPLATPYLCAAIDVYTGMITGFYLSLNAINSTIVLETLVQSISSKVEYTTGYGTLHEWPIMGMPVLILVDNGMDYRSQTLREFCLKYNIILEFAPLRQPRYKSFIERWFGVLSKALRSEVPGTRPPLKERLINPDLSPEIEGVLTLQEQEDWLTKWIVDHYHLSNKYGDYVESPLVKWNKAQNGPVRIGKKNIILPAPREIHPSWIERMRFDTLIEEQRRLSKNGVQRLHINYNSPELQKIFAKIGSVPGGVTIKMDTRDIRIIWVINPDSGELIEAFPTHGWASVLVKIFQDRPISDNAWARMRKQIRIHNRGSLAPRDLDIYYANRQQIIKDGQKRTKTTRKEDEISRQNQKKSLTGRRAQGDQSEQTELLTPRTSSAPRVKKKKKPIDWSKVKPAGKRKRRPF